MKALFVPKHVGRILERLNNAGFEAYLVGGCVRDNIMGKEPHDYDITTSATPKQMLECFSDYTTFTVGIAHGTVAVVTDGGTVEVTTFRIDGAYSDGRHPDSVCFSKDIRDDLSRRDFTINAIAYSEKTGTVDPYDGIFDIENKTVRTVGNANERFLEDALRILRALRFSARLDFSIERKTSEAILKNAYLLKKIARERITSELTGMLATTYAARLANVLEEYGDVLRVVMPKLSLSKNTLNAIAHSDNDAILRMSLLLSDCEADDAAELLRSLCMGNKQRFAIEAVLFSKDYVCADKSFLALMRGAATYEQLHIACEMRRLKNNLFDGESVHSILNAMEKENVCVAISMLDICGTDLEALGFFGRNVGELLNALLLSVIAGKVENRKSMLIRFVCDNFVCKPF